MRVTPLRTVDPAGWPAPLPRPTAPERAFLVAFFAPELRDSPALAALSAAAAGVAAIGCSTAGEIFGVDVRDGSISAALIELDRGGVRAIAAPCADADASAAAGAQLAAALSAPHEDGPLRAVFVLSDGLSVNGTPLVRALSAGLPEGVQLSGGLAGDGPRFGQTWTWDGASVASGRVLAVGLYGAHLEVRAGSRGGWDVFGPERRVTGAEGNVLTSLDGRPALQLYKEYLGERARELPASALLFPLAVRLADGQRVVRTVLGVDEEAQSMTFAGDIPEGSLAQLMRANLDRLVDGAAIAAQQSLEQGPPLPGPAVALAISCVGRRLVLGQRIDDEVEATAEQLPPGTTQLGFYSYGELGPKGQHRCELHNQTMTLTLLAEGG